MSARLTSSHLAYFSSFLYCMNKMSAIGASSIKAMLFFAALPYYYYDLCYYWTGICIYYAAIGAVWDCLSISVENGESLNYVQLLYLANE